MKIKPKVSGHPGELRRHAEDRLRARPDNQPSAVAVPKSTVATQRLLHELEVHQIELEMQNGELRKARDELEVALENYTDLYDFAPVGYFTLTAVGTILQVNLTGAHLFGVERSRLVGQPFGLLVSVAQRPNFNSFIEQVFTSQNNQSVDIELLGKNEPPLIVRVRAQRSPAGLDCRAVVVDITELKREEDKVRVSEVRYRRLFEAAHDGVLLLDPGTRKIIDANPFMTTLLGYTHDQLVGKELFEIGLLKDEAASRVAFQKLKKDHQVRYENLPLESQEGRHQEVEVVANLYTENGHTVIQCNIRDITERKRAEAAQRRLDMLTASNQKLEKEIMRRLTLEQALKVSEQQLRHLSHEILHTQEEERKRISRELHDTVLQTLVGINIHLTSLTAKSGDDPKNLQRKITQTQQLVEKSVALVHRFALELRPTVLDDLGLIPALHTFMKDFMKRTGVRTRLTAYAAVNRLPIAKSAVLYRVALEALNNVGLHAQASQVDVEIKKLPAGICLTIKDDGKSFDVKRVLLTKGNGRLGLLGMRERLEMVGGKFSIKSPPGQGTTVTAQIPLNNRKSKNANQPLKTKR
jgi:PAS domain S-box-containing protein